MVPSPWSTCYVYPSLSEISLSFYGFCSLVLFLWEEHLTPALLITYFKVLLLLLSLFSRVQLCATPWTAAYQAPPSIGFSRQEYWSEVPLPSLILCIVVCICQSQSSNLILPPYPLVTVNLFSTSVTLLLFYKNFISTLFFLRFYT